MSGTWDGWIVDVDTDWSPGIKLKSIDLTGGSSAFSVWDKKGVLKVWMGWNRATPTVDVPLYTGSLVFSVATSGSPPSPTTTLRGNLPAADVANLVGPMTYQWDTWDSLDVHYRQIAGTILFSGRKMPQ